MKGGVGDPADAVAVPAWKSVGTSRRAGCRSRRLVRFLLLAALAATPACSSPLVQPGQTFRPTPSPMPTFDATRTGFDGVVVDDEGEPLAGVRVDLVVAGRRGSAETTDEGEFFDRGLVGEIEITASLEGYRSEEVTITVMPNSVTEVEIVLEPED
jgi:hypothetical protein